MSRYKPTAAEFDALLDVVTGVAAETGIALAGVSVAAARRAYDHIIRTQLHDRCEDCGQSVRGLAVFECLARGGSSALLCCARCASNLAELEDGGWVEQPPARRHWQSVTLARSGRSASVTFNVRLGSIRR